MKPMRAAMPLFAVAALALAGSAAASDYMLPTLLEGKQPLDPTPEAPPQGPQALPPPAPSSPLAMAVALVAAAAVVVGTMGLLWRRERAA